MGKKNHIGVYFIESETTGKMYVGHSKNLDKRFYRHVRDLNNGIHHCIDLQNDWDLYGEEDFKFRIVKDEITEDEAIELEQYFLDTEDINLYNMSKWATCGDLISYHPDRENIIEKMKNTLSHTFSHMTEDERKQKYGRPGEMNGMYGKHHSDESRNKISERNIEYYKTHDHSCKGKTYDEIYGKETSERLRKNISDRAKKRTGDKNSFYGKHHSEETKQKLRDINKGKKPSNCKKVYAEGKIFESCHDAASAYNIQLSSMQYRIKSKNYPEFYFYEE